MTGPFHPLNAFYGVRRADVVSLPSWTADKTGPNQIGARPAKKAVPCHGRRSRRSRIAVDDARATSHSRAPLRGHFHDRQFTVDASGVIQNVLASGSCAHATGSDGEDGGGVSKVWVTPTTRLDCSAAGNKNCFVPRYSKTDNFKVRHSRSVEIDTRFWKPAFSQPLGGMLARWTDTNGATNEKYSEYNPAVAAFHEAHVEAAERGTHSIRVSDHANCEIARVVSPTGQTSTPTAGSVSIAVSVKNHSASNATYFDDVYCR